MWPFPSAKDEAAPGGAPAKADESTPLAGKMKADGGALPSAAADHSEPRGGGTSLLGATAILATFSTTSSNVMYPSVYGVLGIFVGPFLGVALQGFMCVLAVLTCRLAVRLRCSTLRELGSTLAGPLGARLLGGAQQLNNALFMPVALVLCSESLRDFVMQVMQCTSAEESGPLDVGTCAWWACNVNSLWLVGVLAWPVLLLARDVGDLSWNAYLSIILIVVQTAAIFDGVVNDKPYGNASFVPVDPLLYGSPLPNYWYTVVAAVGTMLYSFCPLFIAVEVSAGMEHPDSISTAIISSFVFNIAVYLITGFFVVDRWGAGLPSPVTEALSGAAASIANGILFYCTFLDFAIVGAVLNRELQAAWMPSFDRACNLANLPTWALITLPSLLFAFGLAIVTPRLDSLAGFLESLCIPFVMLIGVPAMLLLLRLRRDAVQKAIVTDKMASLQVTALEMTRGWEPTLLLGVVIGVALLFAVFAETLYSIVYETDYNGRFFCDVVAV